MQKNSDNISMQEALRLAKSDAGKQLFAALKAQNGQAMDRAMAQAAAGDYSQVKETLSSLLASPEIKAMLEQIGGQSHE